MQAHTRAVAGLAAGAVGTFVLDRLDWFMWNRLDETTRDQTRSVRPGGEPPAHVLASRLEQALSLDLSNKQHEVAGLAVHFGIGIAPAAIYALTRDKLPGRGPARGLLYGLAMFLAQDEGLNTVTGLGARPTRYPWQAHARGLVAHLVYGVAVEMTLNAIERRFRKRAGRH